MRQVEDGLRNYSNNWKETEAWTKKNISQYAADSYTEFVAESFLKYHNPKPKYVEGSMPKWWENMVRDLGLGKYVTKSEPAVSNVDRPLPNGPRFLSPEWFTDGLEREVGPSDRKDSKDEPRMG
jgi:hypothetical protein